MSIDTREERETNEHYHADFAHISHGMIEVFLESPALYKARFVDQTIPSPEPTPDMQLGSLTHAVILEPDRWTERFCLSRLSSRRGSAWQDEQAEAAAIGCELILPEQLTLAYHMRDAVLDHPVAAMLLARAGVAERSIRWIDPMSRIPCKARPDWLIDDPAIDWALCTDLKSAADPRPDPFLRAVMNYGYHRQAAHYVDAVRTTTEKSVRFLWIVVGKTPPHDVYVYQCSDAMLLDGGSQNTVALARLSMSIESGRWFAPGQDKIQLLELPRWAKGVRNE